MEVDEAQTLFSIMEVPSDNNLHIAASEGDVEVVKNIVHESPVLAKEFNERGYTALHLAARNGSVDVVRELLDGAGTNQCLVTDKNGLLPIHHAALNKKLEVLELLIQVCGESARKKTCLSDTILHLAVKSEDIRVLKFLMDAMEVGVDFMNAKNDMGNTILHLAVARKQLQIVEFLVNKEGIEVNAENQRSLTPLDVLLESPTQSGDKQIKTVLQNVGGKITTRSNYAPTSAQANTDVPVDHEYNSAQDQQQKHSEDYSKKSERLIEQTLQKPSSISAQNAQMDTESFLVIAYKVTIVFTSIIMLHLLLRSKETIEKKFEMITALIASLVSITGLFVCLMWPKFMSSWIVIFMISGFLVVTSLVLPNREQTLMIIFAISQSQLVIYMHQLAKIERTSEECIVFGISAKTIIGIVRATIFVTVVAMSCAALVYIFSKFFPDLAIQAANLYEHRKSHVNVAKAMHA